MEFGPCKDETPQTEVCATKNMNMRGEKAAILIVEDEAKMRRLVELRLGEEGFVVHSAADAESGLQLLVREKPTWW